MQMFRLVQLVIYSYTQSFLTYLNFCIMLFHSTAFITQQLHNHIKARNSARLTNQRGSYAFSCSPFTVYVRYILWRAPRV